MASITKISTPEYELRLTREETKALYTILLNTGGPLTGPRQHADSILKALKSIGFHQEYPTEGSILLTETT